MKKQTKTLTHKGTADKYASYGSIKQCLFFVKNLLIAEILYKSNIQEEELQIMYANLRV